MDDDLYRVESAVSATSSGDLTWERWTLDCAAALGLSGRQNPLGFAVVRYLADPPCSTNVWGVVLVLVTELGKLGYSGDQAKEAAWHAFDFWRDVRCRECCGRGVVDATQRVCPVCRGSKHRPLPDGPEIVRAGIGALMQAEQWMEGQLRAKLKRGG